MGHAGNTILESSGLPPHSAIAYRVAATASVRVSSSVNAVVS